MSDISGFAAGQQGGGGGPSDQVPPGFAASQTQPGYMPPPPQPGYAPYGYPYPAPYPMAMPQQRNGMALAGMILGIVGLATSIFYIGGVIGIVGLIFSIIGIRAVNRTGQQGKGMAIAGLVTSIIAIIVNAIEIAVLVWFLHTATTCAQNQTADPSYFQHCVTNSVPGN